MLYKRGKNWWVRFTIRGREIRVTSGTDRKTLAEEFERRLREQIWRETELGEIQHTWEEATERWLKEKAHKRSLARDRQAFAAVDPDLRGKAVVEIDSELLQRILNRIAAGRSPGTVNRIMAAVRGVLSACVKWGWLSAVPKVEAQHVERTDPRFISHEQFGKLVDELPPHLAKMARFAVATGLRWANISGLQWSMLDLDRGVAYIPGGETKNRKPIPVPLSADAKSILGRLSEEGRGSSGKAISGYVFRDHLGRAPVGSPKTAWGKAVKRAGLQGFRFHDLRHTWAAWHTMSGTPPIVLKALGGWSSLSMVERYAALNPGHLSEWADNSSRTKKGTEQT
jgi:integrase